jgi:hypothetical protein
VHLFNDSLICSQRNAVGSFKLAKTIDLNGSSVSPVNLPGMTFTFSVGGGGSTEIFRCQDNAEFRSWLEEIEPIILSLRSKRTEGRSNNMVSSPSGSLPAMKDLGNRALSVHKFLASEMRLSDLVSTLVAVVTKPMMDASNGGILSTGDRRENVTASKVQAAAITEALQSNEVKGFLRASESLSVGIKEFVTNLKSHCESLGWSEEISIGGVFNSNQSKSLFNQYKVYATGQQGCLRILKGPLFSSFYRDAENALSNFPGNLIDKLENPRNRPAQYLEFLNQLLQLTSPSHTDAAQLTNAVKAMSGLATEVEGTVKSKRNYEKLLEIQSALVVTTNLLYAVDGKFVQKLNSPDRKFLKEGDLKKVCRKKNKLFRFWLFNDYLCYGSSLGNSTFSFHRALDLKTCSVAIVSDQKNAFQLKGAEKSFIVIAPNETSQNDWVNKIKDARAALGVQDDASQSAPVWVADHSGDGCVVCHQVNIYIYYIKIYLK